METVLDTAFVQVPFETVVKQVEGGRLVVNGLISLFQVRRLMLLVPAAMISIYCVGAIESGG